MNCSRLFLPPQRRRPHQGEGLLAPPGSNPCRTAPNGCLSLSVSKVGNFETLFDSPVFQAKSANSSHVPSVVGDEAEVPCEGVGGDGNVEVFDEFALLVEADFDACEGLADGIGPGNAQQFCVEDGPALAQQRLSLALGQKGESKLDFSDNRLGEARRLLGRTLVVVRPRSGCLA